MATKKTNRKRDKRRDALKSATQPPEVVQAVVREFRNDPRSIGGWLSEPPPFERSPSELNRVQLTDAPDESGGFEMSVSPEQGSVAPDAGSIDSLQAGLSSFIRGDSPVTQMPALGCSAEERLVFSTDIASIRGALVDEYGTDMGGVLLADEAATLLFQTRRLAMRLAVVLGSANSSDTIRTAERIQTS